MKFHCTEMIQPSKSSSEYACQTLSSLFKNVHFVFAKYLYLHAIIVERAVWISHKNMRASAFPITPKSVQQSQRSSRTIRV